MDSTGREAELTVQRELSEEQTRQHDDLVGEGNSLCSNELLAGISRKGKPGWRARSRLKKALACFEQALQIHPDNWAVLWTVGKIHQRFRAYEQALECFSKAHRLKPDESNVAREAGITAIELGRAGSAISLLQQGIAARPDDAGLVANLALAYLANGDIRQAKSHALQAVESDRQDPVNNSVLHLVCEVEAGVRPIPRSFL